VKELTPKVIEHSATGATAIGGVTTATFSFMGFLNEYAVALGLIMTFISLVVATFYHELNRRKQDSNQAIQSENKTKIKRLEDQLEKIGQRKSDKVTS
tara:strand:+ start:926 stop:1219 length:294 start_codon:yes stop_codon:yes gene_type:complete